jgi:hypothetical protein
MKMREKNNSKGTPTLVTKPCLKKKAKERNT